MSTTATTAPAKAALPNEGRPGYTHTKLGWIPEDWEAEKIGKHLQVLTDFESNGSFADVKANVKVYDQPEYAWYVRATDLENDSHVDNVRYVDKATYDFLKKTTLHGGEVLVMKRGDIGKVYRYLSNGNPATLAPNLYLVRCKPTLDNEFLYRYLTSGVGTKELQRINGSTTIGAIYKDDFKALKVICPPIVEQRRIAAVLGAWDRAIATVQQLLAAQQERKRGLIGTALSEVYHHRRKVSIGDIANEISERNMDGTDPIVLSCSKHRGFVSSLEYFKKQVFSDDRSNYKVIRRGQFGFPANHIEEGSIALLREHEIGIVSPIYVVFEFDLAMVNSEFMYYLFKSDRYRHIFRTSTNASVDRRGSLRWSDFKNLWVPLPERDEQDRLARLLTGLDRQIEQTQNYLDHLTTQKRGLMQQLLTGAVRVKH